MQQVEEVVPHIHLNDALRRYLEATGERTPPEYVYHYTSARAAESILNSGKIFATQANFLDDELEYSVGLRRYREVLDVLLEESDSLDDRDAHAWSIVLEAIRGLADWKYFQSSYPSIASFSTEGDLLSQWRSYADDGRGYAIGFPVDSLAPPTWSYLGNSFMAPCLYEKSVQRELLLEIVRELTEEVVEWAGHHGEVDPQFYGDEGKDLRLVLAHYSCLFKDRAYAEENEWRLVLPGWMGRGSVDEFRASDGLLRPVRHIQLPEATEFDIRVGPRAHKVAVEAMALLKDTSDYMAQDSSIERSQIPLRF